MINSVTLDESKCKGCTACIKQCPTEAVRVRRGRARIIRERCVDCGHCVRVCPRHAQKAICDDFSLLEKYQYTVALPPPELYGQFRNMEDINYVLAGLQEIGFDAVYEVARAAEMVSDWTRKAMKDGNLKRPILSSACPATVRLICQRFPNLVGNLAPVISPMELAAIKAREEAAVNTGLDPAAIGVFYITPCPARATAAHHPVGLDKPVIDGVLSLSDIYIRLLSAMKNVGMPAGLTTSGLMGIGWAANGGECAALLTDRYIAVDDIENVIAVLEDIENGLLPDVDFVEMDACTQGCVGGCLTVENPFAAKMRIKRLMKYMPVSRNKLDNPSEADLQQPIEAAPVKMLSNDFAEAMTKNAKIVELTKRLPGLGCSSCGAPSCRELAEDIVQGYASEEDCIFTMRERMEYFSGVGDAEQYLPPPFRKK